MVRLAMVRLTPSRAFTRVDKYRVAMPDPSHEQFLAELGDFVHRMDQPRPDAPLWSDVTIGMAGFSTVLSLREPVVHALLAALRQYQDPRDTGRCDHCGTGRVDEHLICRDCGRPNGVFGQLLLERAARYEESKPITP